MEKNSDMPSGVQKQSGTYKTPPVTVSEESIAAALLKRITDSSTSLTVITGTVFANHGASDNTVGPKTSSTLSKAVGGESKISLGESDLDLTSTSLGRDGTTAAIGNCPPSPRGIPQGIPNPERSVESLRPAAHPPNTSFVSGPPDYIATQTTVTTVVEEAKVDQIAISSETGEGQSESMKFQTGLRGSDQPSTSGTTMDEQTEPKMPHCDGDVMNGDVTNGVASAHLVTDKQDEDPSRNQLRLQSSSPTGDTKAKKKRKSSDASTASRKKAKADKPVVSRMYLYQLEVKARASIKQQKYDEAYAHLQELQNYYGRGKEISVENLIVMCAANTGVPTVRSALNNYMKALKSKLNAKTLELESLFDTCKMDKSTYVDAVAYGSIMASLAKETEMEKIPGYIKAIVNMKIPPNPKLKLQPKNKKDDVTAKKKSKKKWDIAENFTLPVLKDMAKCIKIEEEQDESRLEKITANAEAQMHIANIMKGIGQSDEALECIRSAKAALEQAFEGKKYLKQVIYAELELYEAKALGNKEQKGEEQIKELKALLQNVEKHARISSCEKIKMNAILKEKEKLLKTLKPVAKSNSK